MKTFYCRNCEHEVTVEDVDMAVCDDVNNVFCDEDCFTSYYQRIIMFAMSAADFEEEESSKSEDTF